MTDLFESKSISPMLIKDEVEAFNDPNYIFELKFDGIRCVAFLDAAKGTTEFFNKRKMSLNINFPELIDIHKNIRGRCILDGEVFVMHKGRPNFSFVQKRALMSGKHKIELQAKMHPATFVAYDILYYRGKDITKLPLIERKEKLESVIKSENPQFTYSRYVREKGVDLFTEIGKQDLEGIVAKHVDSKYYQGKQSREWFKIKNMIDDDYVICAYILKGAHRRTLILGQYKDSKLVYKGSVAGISKQVFNIIESLPEVICPFGFNEDEEGKITWVKPSLVCKVKFMEYTARGGMRQPVFVNLRDDKNPKECTVKG